MIATNMIKDTIDKSPQLPIPKRILTMKLYSANHNLNH